MSDYFSVELATAHTVILIYIPLCLIISSSKSGSTFLPPVFTFHYVWLLPLTAASYSRNNCMIYIPLCLIITRWAGMKSALRFTFHYVWLFPEIYTIYSCSSYLFTFHYVWLFLIQIVLWLCLILIYIPLCLIISEILSRTIVGTYSFTFHYVWLLLSA